MKKKVYAEDVLQAVCVNCDSRIEMCEECPIKDAIMNAPDADKQMDRITLKQAIENEIWRLVWAGEPTREIAVEMTYDDLWRIVKRERYEKEKDDEKSC